jgi:hypothetical protein
MDIFDKAGKAVGDAVAKARERERVRLKDRLHQLDRMEASARELVRLSTSFLRTETSNWTPRSDMTRVGLFGSESSTVSPREACAPRQGNRPHDSPDRPDPADRWGMRDRRNRDRSRGRDIVGLAFQPRDKGP